MPNPFEKMTATILTSIPMAIMNKNGCLSLKRKMLYIIELTVIMDEKNVLLLRKDNSKYHKYP